MRAILQSSMLVFACLAVVTACSRGPTPSGPSLPTAAAVIGDTPAAETPSPDADARFVDLRDRYFVESLKRYPVTATYLGADGYSSELARINGQLRDYGAGSRDAEVAFYRELQDELARIAPESLSPDNQIDFRVVGAHLAFLERQLTETRYYERAVDTYVAEPFRGLDWQIQGMTDAGGGLRGTEAEWTDVVQRLQAIPAFLATAKANLTDGKASGNLPDRRMVQRDGIDSSTDNAQYFRQTLPETAATYIGERAVGATQLAALRTAAAAAADAYDDFATFMGDTYDLNETVDRFALGEEGYDWRVKNIFGDDRDAGQLYDYGAQQVASFEDELFQVAEGVASEAGLELSFASEAEKRSSTLAVFDYLGQDAPKDDEELLAFYRQAADRAVAYGREHDLFDIPADYQLEIVETPPALRSSLVAAYYPAPVFKEGGVGRFYVTPTGNDPALLRLNNRSSVADTAVHEGFPGHDWHYKFMTQHKDQISNIRWLTPGAVEDSSAMWIDSMAAEGWALYSEELMAEPSPDEPYGFYTAGERLYELQGMVWRAARVRIDTGIHTGRMTYDEAVDYLATHRFMYPGACAAADSDPNAQAICSQSEREVYRYSKWPTQAITYNLGLRAVLGLREAYKAEMGEQYTPKAFHERYMSMGTIPPAYFREVLLAP